jgi:uncharacterized protein YjbI with pentapeptide repeats
LTAAGCLAGAARRRGAAAGEVPRPQLDAVNLRGAALADVSFERCLLGDADFGGASLRSVRFEQCRLAGVDFSRVRFEDVDLRGSELDLARGYESLGGAIISTGQLIALAPGLARQVGIIVRDHS